MKESTNKFVLVLAIFTVWVLWGSTPVFIRFALDWMPPFVISSFRFLIAGAILCAIALTVTRARPTRHMLVNAALSSVLLLLLGNGVMTWTLQFLPVGLNSVLMSLSPVWLTMIEWRWARIRPGRLASIGMVLGIAGIAVLFQPKSLGSMPLVPALLALGSSVTWAFGAALQRHDPPQHPMLATGIQMIFGSVLFGVEALVLGEWAHWHPAAVQALPLIGFVWLVVVGSLLSYPAFIYTMRHAGAGLAATYAYVNPIVGVAAGMLVFQERPNLTQAISGAIILAGVALMVVPPRRGADPLVVPAASPAAAART